LEGGFGRGRENEREERYGERREEERKRSSSLI
jgi:hypothetical protein